MRTKAIAWGLPLALLVGGAWAEDLTGDQAGAVRVTWADLVRLVDRHPRLAAGASRVDAARGRAEAAGAAPNPTLEIELGRGFARDGGAARLEWGLALGLPLGWIAPRGPRIQAAEAEIEAALAEGRALRRDVLLELQARFWELVSAQARVASLEELAAQTAALVDLVRRRVATGELRPLEATRIEIELEKVTGEVEAARLALGASQAELALWLGAPRAAAIVAIADMAAVQAVPSLDEALAELHAGHPALAAARARVRVQEHELEAERLARVPELALSGFASHELDRRAYGAGLVVELPLWSWNSGRIAQAEAELAAGRSQAEAASLELEGAVIRAQAACQASAATAARLGAAVVPRAESAAATIERTYQLGEVGLLELIDSRRTLLDARRLHLDALSRAHLDCGRLGALVGEEL